MSFGELMTKKSRMVTGMMLMWMKMMKSSKKRTRVRNQSQRRHRPAMGRRDPDRPGEQEAAERRNRSRTRRGCMSRLSTSLDVAPEMTGRASLNVATNSWLQREECRKQLKPYGRSGRRRVWTTWREFKTRAWKGLSTLFCWSTWEAWVRMAWWHDTRVLRAEWSPSCIPTPRTT